jgi:hypothetical protein
MITDMPNIVIIGDVTDITDISNIVQSTAGTYYMSEQSSQTRGSKMIGNITKDN